MLKIRVILLIICMIFSSSVFALAQQEKLWLGIGATRNLTNDGKWKYLIFSQARYINESEPWQSLLLEGSIGNELNQNVAFWMGYRMTERNPDDGFNPESRLFQQVISRFVLSSTNELFYRARLEETTIRQNSSVAVRLRHRLAFSHNEPIIYHLEPFLYEELFTQLVRTDFTPNDFITENRVFIGFNWRLENKQWVEIGYLNQFQMRLPNQSQNTMSHVLVAIYNL